MRATFRNPYRLNLGNLSVSEIAYIAGVFDGEGWFSQRKQTGYWRVGIANTNERLILWLARKIGGQFYCQTAHRETPLWQWGAQSRADVLVFTTTVLPYLVVKRSKAQQALGDTIDRLGVETANRILEIALDSAAGPSIIRTGTG